MNKQHLYTLLNIIKNKGDIKKLTRERVSFQEIAELTNRAIKDNLLVFKDGSILISELGVETISKLDKIFKITDKKKWIEKENKSKIQKLDKNFIFLPNQNEIHF